MIEEIFLMYEGLGWVDCTILLQSNLDSYRIWQAQFLKHLMYDLFMNFKKVFYPCVVLYLPFNLSFQKWIQMLLPLYTVFSVRFYFQDISLVILPKS